VSGSRRLGELGRLACAPGGARGGIHGVVVFPASGDIGVGARTVGEELISDVLESSARFDRRTLFESLIIAGLALYHLNEFQQADILASAASRLAEEKKPLSRTS
jgi:hypothetical protein